MGTPFRFARRRHGYLVLLGVGTLINASCQPHGAAPTTEPALAAATSAPATSDSAGTVQPPIAYPAPYRAPKVAQITDVLDRLRDRLDAATAPRFIDRKTKQPIADVSKPALNVILDPGAEGKFNPISYPMGVINSGMLAAAEATGDARFSAFPVKWFDFYAKYLPVLAQWPRTTLAPPTPAPATAAAAAPADDATLATTAPADPSTDDATRPTESAESPGQSRAAAAPQRVQNPFRPLLAPNSLDDCGSMAAAMVKARLAGLGPDLSDVIQRSIAHVHRRQFRLPDGTLARHRPVAESIWADDMYMGVSLLAQAGKMTGDTAYYDDAAKQVLQIGQHLWVPEKKLMTHGWNSVNPDDHPTYFWGRANGWCMMAMTELLTVLPDDHPARPAVLKQFRAMAQGVASLQAGDGLWHQMLDRTDTYTETSASAMFAYAFARGVDRGWLDAPAYGPVAVSAWDALAARVDAHGHLSGTCIGTGYADDYVYYYHRPAVDDIHGYGPVLLAGAEMIHLMKNPRFAAGSGTDGRSPLTFSPRSGRRSRRGNAAGSAADVSPGPSSMTPARSEPATQPAE